jgi:uncharacterized protein (DUF58 family)
VIPTARLAWLVVLGIPLILLGLFGRTALAAAGAYDGLLIAAVCWDRWTTPDPKRLRIRRVVPPRLVQGRTDHVRLELLAEDRAPVRGALVDHPPGSFTWRAGVATFTLPRDAVATIGYDVTPRERGSFAFSPPVVRTHGALGLVQRQGTLAAASEVRVYPDLVTLSSREASLVPALGARQGSRRSPTPGEGREFHQLRDYVAGDDVRLLDWKSFARRGRPAVREHRAERNQRVLLLLDAGRLMTAQVGDRSKFDWAVQAAGRLARVALGCGDFVGLAAFSRGMKVRIPPGRGPGQLTDLAEALADAQPDLDEPDIDGALRSVLGRHQRRTLVVLFTEVADLRASRAVVRGIASIAPRHLGLVVTLADPDLDRARRMSPVDAPGVFRKVAAEELWQDARLALSRLEARGALTISARADALAAEAVEAYLALKREGRL